LGRRETAGLDLFLNRPQQFSFPGAACPAGRVVVFVVCDRGRSLMSFWS